MPLFMHVVNLWYFSKDPWTPASSFFSKHMYVFSLHDNDLATAESLFLWQPWPTYYFNVPSFLDCETKLNLFPPLGPWHHFPLPSKDKGEMIITSLIPWEKGWKRTNSCYCFLPEYRIKWNQYLWANNHSILKSYLQEKKFLESFKCFFVG